MKNKKKFEALCKFIKSMSKSYDMTEAQWDLHQDILQKIKESSKQLLGKKYNKQPVFKKLFKRMLTNKDILTNNIK
jgi:TRAP-type mannitol/chloroaromatic compound transport system substrate-binding protein